MSAKITLNTLKTHRPQSRAVIRITSLRGTSSDYDRRSGTSPYQRTREYSRARMASHGSRSPIENVARATPPITCLILGRDRNTTRANPSDTRYARAAWAMPGIDGEGR